MKKIKFGEFIQNINKKLVEPKYSRMFICIIIVSYLVVIVKNNKDNIKNKLLEINNLKKNVELPVNIKSKQDLEEFIIKGKNIEFGRAEIKEKPKKENVTVDIKQESMVENTKKELKPDKDNLKHLEKEFDINNPNTVAYKMKQVDAIYLKRLKNKQINRKQQVKKGDMLYVSLTTVNENLLGSNEITSSQARKQEPMKTLLYLDLTVPITKLFIGKNVGSVLKLSIIDMISVLPQDQQKQYKQESQKFKEDASKSANVDVEAIKKYTDDNKIYIVYEILDVIPKSVVKQLKLINNGK